MSTHDIRKQREREHREGRANDHGNCAWCNASLAGGDVYSRKGGSLFCCQGCRDAHAYTFPQGALAQQEGGTHYKGMKIQPMEYIHANGLSYFQGNVVKYVSRYQEKGGAADLRKIIHYCELQLQLEYGEGAK